MHFETTVASLGAGLLRFNDIGFLAIDIIRYNIQQKQSVKVVEHWETWSINSGTRESLDNNIQKRTDKWFDIIGLTKRIYHNFWCLFLKLRSTVLLH